MEKTTSNTPKFYSRLNLPKRKPTPAGSEWAEQCIIDVDSETGAKVLKIVGRENIYEKIQECLEPTKIENIIRRFKEGDTTALGHESGIYADISDMPTNIIEAQKRIQDVQAKFASLPIEIKEKFGNDPTVFMAEILSGKGMEKLNPAPPQAGGGGQEGEKKDEQKQ